MSDITLLDGGMGQEHFSRVVDAPTGFWATKVMYDHPGLVEQVHKDYFDAGATVATANTYALHADRLVNSDFEDRRGLLIQAALDEAHSAQAAHGTGRVAGSIGPLVWSYRSDGQPDYADAKPIFADMAQHLAPRVDILIIETIASLEQARAALDGARETDAPVWLGVTVDDEDGTKLRSGEPVADLMTLEPDAILANCSAPEAIPAALRVFATGNRPFGAYANAFVEITKEFLSPGSTTSELSKRDLTPQAYGEHVQSWVDMGATIVGGCCETGPSHIREIAQRLTAAGHVIV